MQRFDQTSTADQVIEGISLENTHAVVTGATSGLGIETCRVLAGAGATVIMVACDGAKLREVKEQILLQQPEAKLRAQRMDLTDFGSIHRAAAEILLCHSAIKRLVNNPGVMACPLVRTAQGFEMQFVTNHLGHVLLTGLLAPALVDATPGRVVNLSSAGHQFAPFNFSDPNYNGRDDDKGQSYGESKTANILFTVGLDARTRALGLRAFAVHPGVIATNLSRHKGDGDYDTLMARRPAAGAR
ncbi:MAG: SDR family NAD(P)-dependent oxidoreductase [Halioglobus sp.]|nr:SDR family NAD(P)-dependent oxidoreductase [Halioglobus sp.]